MKSTHYFILDIRIQQLEGELRSFRSKAVSKAIFGASLCCFEAIEPSKGVLFGERMVQLSGNCTVITIL